MHCSAKDPARVRALLCYTAYTRSKIQSPSFKNCSGGERGERLQHSKEHSVVIQHLRGLIQIKSRSEQKCLSSSHFPQWDSFSYTKMNFMPRVGGKAGFQQSARLAVLGILRLQEGSWADHSLFQIAILIKRFALPLQLCFLFLVANNI